MKQIGFILGTTKITDPELVIEGETSENMKEGYEDDGSDEIASGLGRISEWRGLRSRHQRRRGRRRMREGLTEAPRG